MGSIKDWLRLARAPLAPTAAFDSVACALLARGPGLGLREGRYFNDLPAPLSLQEGLLLAAASVLVYFAGMTMNDVFDRRRDATIHPERPLPSGRISPAAAIVFGVLCAGGALAIALASGSLPFACLVGAALLCALAYDATPRRFTALGCVFMGATRAANAASGVVPLLAAGLTHPLSLAGPLLIGLYSAGITAHSASEGLPAPRPANALFMRIASAVAFAGAGALCLLGADGLALGVFCASAIVLSVVFARVPRKAPVRAQVLELLLGFYWLDAILASGGFAGRAWLPVLTAFAAAYAAILGSQLFVRALRPRL